MIAEPTTPNQVRSKCAIAVKQAAASSTTPIDPPMFTGLSPSPSQTTPSMISEPSAAIVSTGSQPAMVIFGEPARLASARARQGRHRYAVGKGVRAKGDRLEQATGHG